MRKKPKGIDLRYAWEVEQISRAPLFTVIRRGGRGGEDTRLETNSLDLALEVASDLGPGEHSRRPMVYAVTHDRMSIHVDERHLRMLKESILEPFTGKGGMT